MQSRTFNRLFLVGFVLLGAASAEAYWPYGGFHSSTAAESYLRGMGAYLDSLGNLHVNNAIAAEHFENAHQMYLQNDVQRVEDYFEKRAINEKNRKAHASRGLTPPETVELAKRNLPARLKPDQRDPKTGALQWPAALKAEIYADDRIDLENLFTERAKNPVTSGPDSVTANRITERASRMLEKLGDQAHDGLSVSLYTPANVFLKTLRYEARF